jgi:hypothetical protein
MSFSRLSGMHFFDISPSKSGPKMVYFLKFDFSTALYYTPLPQCTLHYTTARPTALHYATLLYMKLHYTPLHYITLQYTTFHYTKFHSLRSTTLQLQLKNDTPQISLHKMEQEYITLPYTTRYSTKNLFHQYITVNDSAPQRKGRQIGRWTDRAHKWEKTSPIFLPRTNVPVGSRNEFFLMIAKAHHIWRQAHHARFFKLQCFCNAASEIQFAAKF